MAGQTLDFHKPQQWAVLTCQREEDTVSFSSGYHTLDGLTREEKYQPRIHGTQEGERL
jgi:hypothetical protein